jgi:hypothetical protein
MKDVGKFYGNLGSLFYCHFVYFVAIGYISWSFWYIFPVLVHILYQEKSGNPDGKAFYSNDNSMGLR